MKEIIIDKEFQKLIPPLQDEEKIQLEENLIAEGCRDALVTWQGILLDGHNRYEICKRLKIPFRTLAIELPDREAAADWIDKNQLGRRNLNPDQISYLRGRRYNRMKKAQGSNNQYVQAKSEKGQIDTLHTANKLSDEYGVSPATVKRNGKMAEYLDEHPTEAEAVLQGRKTFTQVKREAKKKKLEKNIPSKPTGKYRVIYADPPWKYGDQLTPSYGATRYHYPTLSIKELCQLSIKSIAEKDAVLFLWVTSPLLGECWPVIEAWGFKYKTSFVWDKVKHNMGHYNSVRHEFLLVCTRGSCLPDSDKLIDSVQSIERTSHSTKPEEFRNIIERLYTHGEKIELFAREDHKGWSVWGNEVS